MRILLYQLDNNLSQLDECKYDDSILSSLLDDKFKSSHNILQVDDPYDADWIIFPYDLSSFITKFGYIKIRKFLESLPFFKNFESKHVFYDSGDLDFPLAIGSVIFKTSISKSRKDIYSISFPYNVPDHILKAEPNLDFSKITHDTTFIGSIQHKIRISIIESIVRTEKLKSLVKCPDSNDFTKNSWYYIPPGEFKNNMEKMYVDSLKTSLTVVCPRGIGHICLRFYETLRMGRIQVLIDDDCVLPLQDEIDYNNFSLIIKETEIDHTGDIILDFISTKSPRQLKAMCLHAMETWNKYFANDLHADIALHLLSNIKSPLESIWLSKNNELLQKEEKLYRSESLLNLIEVDPNLIGLYKCLWNSKGIHAQILDKTSNLIDVNGVRGIFDVEGIVPLYKNTMTIGNGSAIVIIGDITGLSSSIIANGLVSGKKLDTTIYNIVDDNHFDEAKYIANLKISCVDDYVKLIYDSMSEASRLFRDGSVSLLFIDNLAAEPQLRAIIKNWSPKMSQSGKIVSKGHELNH